MDMPLDPAKDGSLYRPNVIARQRRGRLGRAIFATSTVIAMIALLLLLYNILSDSYTLVAVEYEADPATLSDRPLVELSKEELTTILQANTSAGLFRRLERDKPFAERTQAEVVALVQERVVGEEIVATYSWGDVLRNRAAIEQEIAEKHPDARIQWKGWLNREFLTSTMAGEAWNSGVRTALLGSLWMISITMLLAVPIGIGAAIYLEEYATDNLVNRIIQTNISNLAGVPSIIYGMLGLAIFVRSLERVTSGAAFGSGGDSGRTILSASLTMALLVLPILIIAAQEAIRAVPRSLRLASFGLGATRWQTIWHHVLPAALPTILTGTILAMSRAIGETAPLIVVGASTYIVSNPDGPFSKFTVLPIQIYNWAKDSRPEFHNAAAAAILTLLALLLTLNAFAVLLRNRARQLG